MKRIGLLAGLCSLLIIGCQKEEQLTTRQNFEYMVQSPEDETKWITIEEYNKIMDSRTGEKIEGSRAKIRCYYYPDNSGVRELGTVCAKSDKSECSDYEPCMGKD